jgi:serine/threonine protein kinase
MNERLEQFTFSDWIEEGDETFDKNFRSILHGLLEFDPEKRLTAHQALQHPFISQS